jgi:transcriptional regulator with XRE-family HTH domain
MKSHNEFVKELLDDPEIKKEYERLEPEFSLLDELLKARKLSGLTQAEIAEKMGTKPPAVSRLLSGAASNHPSPTVATLRNYANACGMKLKIQLVREKI